ncbi:1606_t:CDS:2, partial [Gigaspora rosea]
QDHATKDHCIRAVCSGESNFDTVVYLTSDCFEGTSSFIQATKLWAPPRASNICYIEENTTSYLHF